MNKSIVGILFSPTLICAALAGNAHDLQVPFTSQFDSAIVRTVYGEADHSISVSWTADSILVSTDLYGGRTVSDFNATNRISLLKVLEDVYREQTVAHDDSCYRTWVQATFYHGNDSITRRACLFPSDRAVWPRRFWTSLR
jgi:hypothetical protein